MLYLLSNSQIIEMFLCSGMNGAIPGEPLPPSDGDVNIERVNLHAIADAPYPFSRNQRASGAEETIENDVAACRAIEHCVGDQLDRVGGRMQCEQIAFIGVF